MGGWPHTGDASTLWPQRPAVEYVYFPEDPAASLCGVVSGALEEIEPV